MSETFVSDPFHPGEFIKQELEARGWKQVDLIQITGLSARAINELIAGKRRITANTAQQLADAFGSQPEEWLKLQNMYDLAGDRQGDSQ